MVVGTHGRMRTNTEPRAAGQETRGDSGTAQADTEVYLTITAALLQEANARFHDFTQDLLPPPGGQP
jgi:hypothetical protein